MIRGSSSSSSRTTEKAVSALKRKDVRWCNGPSWPRLRQFRSKNPISGAWSDRRKMRGETVINGTYFNLHHVYLATNSSLSGLYKIGISLNAIDRVKWLTIFGQPCDYPILLDVIVCCCRKHAKIVEALLHSFLDNYRIGGEWFSLDDDKAVDLCLLFLQIKGIECRQGQLADIKQPWDSELRTYWLPDLDWLSQVCALLNRPFQFTNPEPDPLNPHLDSDSPCDDAKQSSETTVSKRDNLLHWGVKVPRRPLACSHDVQGKKVCCLGN